MGNRSQQSRRSQRRGSVIAHLEKALARSPGNYTIDDVREALVSENAKLWAGEKSVAITETARSFHVWLAGGDMAELMNMLVRAEKDHAEAGFDMVTISDARPGWERVLAPLGYKKRVMLVKEL